MRQYTFNYQVSSLIEEQVRPMRGAVRDYLLIENPSTDPIYLNWDSHASSDDGIEIPSGGHYERGDSGLGTPQNTIFLKGSTVGLQKVRVTQGYAT